MEKIKMVDLQRQYQRIKREIDTAIQKVLNTTAFIQGPEVHEFSDALAAFHKINHVITCGNGTDALQIALMALDLQQGDEVILPVHTYVATAEVVALLKLTPVFIDVDVRTFNLDVNQLEDKITDKTRVIVPVHLYGQCSDMEPILTTAEKYGLYVIEDGAQAIGSEYTFSNGKKMKAGAMGTIGCISFFPSKNLGCFGDGGAMMTNDPLLAEKMKMIANHGQKKKYYHDCIGVNSRLDTIQAAILMVKLQYLEEYTRKRNEAASFYDEALKEISELIIPFRSNNSTHVFNQYTVKVAKGNRNELKQYLASVGVPTVIYYPMPLHLQLAYKQLGLEEGTFPVAETLSKTVISLPIHSEIERDQLAFICSSVKSYFS